MRKLLLWLLLLPLLLLLLTYSALPYVARTVIEQWLREQGFSEPSIQLAHPHWNRLVIDHLHLLQAGPERRIALQADQVSVHYDPMRLLLTREIEELRIPRLALQIDASANLEQRIEQDADHRVDLAQVLPALLFQYAPSQRLVTGQLLLDYHAPEQPPLHVSGNLELTRNLLQSRLAIALDPDAESPADPVYIDLNFDQAQRLSLHLSLHQQALLHAEGQLRTEADRWHLALASQLQPSALRDWLTPLLSTDLPVIDAEGLELALELNLPSLLPLTLEPLLQQIELKLQGEGVLQLDNTRLPAPLSLANKRLQPRFNAELQQGQLTFSSQFPALALKLKQQTLPPAQLKLSGKGRLPSGPWSGQLQLRTAEPTLRLDGDWRHDGEQSALHWHLQSVSLNQLEPLIRSTAPGLGFSYPAPLRLSAGQLSLSGDSNRRGTGLSHQLKGRLDGVALAWQESLNVPNLTASLNADLATNGRLSVKGRVHAGTLSAGLPLQLAPLDYQYDRRADGRSTLYLSASQLDLLGGQIRLPALALNPAAPRIQTRARIDGLALDQILALYQQPGLSGSVRLEGELPLQIEGSAVRVQQGWLRNQGPGWLRYQPDPALAQSASQNPGLQLALSALSNLQIEQLNMLLDYAPNGDLELVSRFQGHNPDWQQGRPIDLTLNLEENLLMLLRSLQLGGRISDSVDRQLNRQ